MTLQFPELKLSRHIQPMTLANNCPIENKAFINTVTLPLLSMGISSAHKVGTIGTM